MGVGPRFLLRVETPYFVGTIETIKICSTVSASLLVIFCWALNRQKSVFMQKWRKLSKKIAKMQKYRNFALEHRSRELFACQKPVFLIGFFFNQVFLIGFFYWEKIKKNKEK